MPEMAILAAAGLDAGVQGWLAEILLGEFRVALETFFPFECSALGLLVVGHGDQQDYKAQRNETECANYPLQ